VDQATYPPFTKQHPSSLRLVQMAGERSAARSKCYAFGSLVLKLSLACAVPGRLLDFELDLEVHCAGLQCQSLISDQCSVRLVETSWRANSQFRNLLLHGVVILRFTPRLLTLLAFRTPQSTATLLLDHL